MSIAGGRILAVEALAFDLPGQGITRWDEHGVTWRSTTAGDHDAIVVQVDHPDAAVRVQTPGTDFSFTPAQLAHEPMRLACSGVDAYIQAVPEPSVPGPMEVAFEWQDPSPMFGRNEYWIRLRQRNGEMAWSSPLYWTNTSERG